MSGKFRVLVYKLDHKTGKLKRYSEFIRDPDTQEYFTRAKAQFFAEQLFVEQFDPRDFEIYVEPAAGNMGADMARAKKSKRPPKKWFKKCVRAVKNSSPHVDPKKVCGANWYHKMSANKKRAAILEEKRDKSLHQMIRCGDKVAITVDGVTFGGHVVEAFHDNGGWYIGYQTKPRGEVYYWSQAMDGGAIKAVQRGTETSRKRHCQDDIRGDQDSPLLTSEEGIPPALIEQCLSGARSKILRETGRKQLPKGEWLKLRQECVEKLQKYMAGKADGAKSRKRLRKRVGTSKKHTTCTRCGKKNLKKTHVFDRADGTREYLGSECAKDKMECPGWESWRGDFRTDNAKVSLKSWRPQSPKKTWEGECLSRLRTSGLAKNEREAFFLCLSAKNRGMSIEELISELYEEAAITKSASRRGRPRSVPKQYPAGGSKRVSHGWGS